jgi:glycosyltransferase involved in cell wall biosynthesis
MSEPILAVVVPCYNEKDVLPETAKRLKTKIQELIDHSAVSSESFITFIDDGSSDDTWALIEELHQGEPTLFRGIKLAANKGHQFALLSGLESVASLCDAAISIDADLQDDIGIFEEMLCKYNENGCDVVYAVRNKRETDTFFKRWSALTFYKLMRLLGVRLVFNHADYRLMSQRVLKALSAHEEANLFLRGIFPDMGFKSSEVYYDRSERFAGSSKYPLHKMVSFAIDGITSFSITPLRIISIIGMSCFLITAILSFWALYQKHAGETIPGWSSLIISIYFLGAVQLIGIGVIGEYIGKIYKETKKRPRYIIDKTLGIKS